MKRAFTLVEVCLALFVLTALGGATVTVMRCKPPYHCANVLDENGNPTTNTFCSLKAIATLKKDGCGVLGMNFADIVACQRICGTNQESSAISDMIVVETQVWGGTNINAPFLLGDGTNQYVNTYDWEFRGLLHFSDDGNAMVLGIDAIKPMEVFHGLEVRDYPPQAKLTK